MHHDVRELVMSELEVKRSAVMTKGRKANRILLNVLAQTRVTRKPDCHAVTVRHNGCHVTGSEVTVTGVTSPYRGIDPVVTPPGVSDGEVLSQQHEHEPSKVEGEL